MSYPMGCCSMTIYPTWHCPAGARPVRKYMHGNSQAMAGRLVYWTACQRKDCMVVENIGLVTKTEKE